MAVFNPFRKDFEQVTEADLDTLKSVSEGWNIEYKRQKLPAKEIAKSIASFANSHGGIYFIGITADSSNNCAQTVIGVTDLPDVVRDAINGHLQSFPYFKTYTIRLSAGTHVLMVVVPEGENPPYIHSSGKIYRRQEAASDPIIAETNRHAIDELYSRARKQEQEIEKFRSCDLNFCNGEEDIPHLEIYINTKPFQHFAFKSVFNNDDLREFFRQFSTSYDVQETTAGGNVGGASGKIEFDSASTYHQSMSLRQLRAQSLAYNGLTAIIDIYGNMKVLLPIFTGSISSESLIQRYVSVLNRSNPDSINVIEFIETQKILATVIGLLYHYSNYLHGKGFKESIEIKARLFNCYRKAVYINSEIFIAHVEEMGVPICMKSEQYFPELPLNMTLEELRSKPITQPVVLFALIVNALGVPFEIAVAAVTEEMRNNSQTGVQGTRAIDVT